jgi:hypothetical protein
MQGFTRFALSFHNAPFLQFSHGTQGNQTNKYTHNNGNDAHEEGITKLVHPYYDNLKYPAWKASWGRKYYAIRGF